MIEKITFQTIGTAHSPFRDIEGMPIQPAAAVGKRGSIHVRPEYEAGLQDLDGFSHITLLYYFHRAAAAPLIVTPFLDDRPRGIFATRAPGRPNPIGISTVELLEVHGNILEIQNIDLLDGTPILDIKPHIPAFDHPKV